MDFSEDKIIVQMAKEWLKEIKRISEVIRDIEKVINSIEEWELDYMDVEWAFDNIETLAKFGDQFLQRYEFLKFLDGC